MKKMVVISLLLMIGLPCNGMDYREQQIKDRSIRIKNVHWLNTVAATAGMSYWAGSRTNRALTEYARELPRYFTNFTANKTLDPMGTIIPNWSSRFAALLKKVHLPESLVEKLKPYAGHKACRFPIAIGVGLAAGITFYKLARATNFFGLKALLHKFTGLKHDKYWLKRDKDNQIINLAGERGRLQSENARLRGADLEGQLRRLRSENIRIREGFEDQLRRLRSKNDSLIAEAADRLALETRYEGHIRRLNSRISDLEGQQILFTKQSRLKTLKIFDLFSTITNLIKNDPSKCPDINKYQAIVLELLQDWCQDRKRDEPIPEAFRLSLAIIETLPLEIKMELIQQTSKMLLNPALETEDTSLLPLMKRYGTELTHANTDILKNCSQKSHLLYPFVDGESCPVCLECHTPSTPAVRACGHVLCKTCYPTMTDAPCPICRKDSNGVAQQT